jgi:hypothetical protein
LVELNIAVVLADDGDGIKTVIVGEWDVLTMMHMIDAMEEARKKLIKELVTNYSPEEATRQLLSSVIKPEILDKFFRRVNV